MDWFTFIILVALILVPIVLLCGFAGCGLDTVGTLFTPPTGLCARGKDTASVEVAWQDDYAQTYRVERAASIGSFAKVGDGIKKYLDPALPEGTTFRYRLVQADFYTSDDSRATTLPNAPSILDAIGVGTDSIRVTWKNNSATANTFVLQLRQLPSGGVSQVSVGAALTFTHTGLAAGSTYEYRVIAIVDGFECNVPTKVRSAPSDAKNASPLPAQWKPAYDGHPLTTDKSDFKNACRVQRINGPARGAAPANLTNGGSKVRITLRANTTEGIEIKAMSISPAFEPGTPGRDPWDSDGAPVPVPLPAGGLTLAANGTMTVGPVDYVLDKTRDVLIAFDIGAALGAGRMAPVTGPSLYSRNNTAQALTADRVAGGYGTSVNDVYLIERIEVFG